LEDDVLSVDRPLSVAQEVRLSAAGLVSPEWRSFPSRVGGMAAVFLLGLVNQFSISDIYRNVGVLVRPFVFSHQGEPTLMKSNGLGSLARSPVHLLHRVSQAVENVFATEIVIERLTPRQLAVLTTVAQNEGLSQTGIVDRTGIDRSTLADIVRRLQKRGLLQRRRTKEDARAYAVKLTDEGRRVLRAAEPLANRVDRRVLNVLPAKRREEFVGALATIVTTLERSTPRSS
jgi:MarR family transcriptional regulator, temperature-dependent positive regulator of motility